MPEHGIEYLELRMLDLDPSSSVGVRTGTLRFIRLLASYLIMQPPLKENEVEEMLVTADKMNEVVAEENPQATCRY